MEDIFDRSPALSPWYFKDYKPLLCSGEKKFNWKYIEKINGKSAHALTLIDEQEKVVGILWGNIYIFPNKDNSKFLVWNRTIEKGGPPTLQLFIYETKTLEPIVDFEKKIIELDRRKFPSLFYFASKPLYDFRIEIDINKKTIDFDFADQLNDFENFCLVTDVPGLYVVPPDIYWANTAIFHFENKQNKIHLYPQDWYNKSNWDFTYVWITSAYPDPESGSIYVRGIRFSDQILDETGRQVLK